MHPATPAARFALGIDLLCRLIARHGHLRLLAGPLVVLIWGRVRGIAAEAAVVLTRLQEGRLRRYPARRAPRPGASPRRQPSRSALPRGEAWLVALIPETAASGAQLQTLLADPEISQALQAAPQLRRTLRPLCRMLGVRLPPVQPPAPHPAAASQQHRGAGSASPYNGPRSIFPSWPDLIRPSPAARRTAENCQNRWAAPDGRIKSGHDEASPPPHGGHPHPPDRPPARASAEPPQQPPQHVRRLVAPA